MGDGIRDTKHNKVPPSRYLLVHLHLLVMLKFSPLVNHHAPERETASYRVVDDKWDPIPWVEGSEERLEVVPVPDEYMSEDSPKREIGSNKV